MSLLATISGLSESKHQSDTPVPPEILSIVEALKKHVTEQKNIRDEFNSYSVKSLNDLTAELHELQRSVTSVLSGLRRQGVQTSHMSEEVLKVERNSSMVQRTLDMTYTFSQTSPEITEYFKLCVSSFGTRVQTYKQEVQEIEDLLSSSAKTSLAPRELAEVLRKLDDQFMSLAAQLYTLNEELSSAKHQYLRQRRTLDGKVPILLQTSASKSTIDSLLSLDADKTSSGKSPYGPSPFATSVVAGGTPVNASLGVGLGLQATVPAVGTSSPFSISSSIDVKPAVCTATAGFSFAGAPLNTTTSSATGLMFGSTALSSTNTSKASIGFNFAAATPNETVGLGSLKTPAGGFGFGGVFPTSSTAAATASVFGGSSSLFGPK